MAEVGVAFVSIVPTAKGFGSQLAAQTGPGAAAAGTSGGKKFGGTFMGASKSALKGFAGIFAVGAVVKGIQSVVAEAREAEKVSAITENRIKTMGNAANISAAQIGELANSIARKTGVDDEQIQSGANLLLSFKNIREEVGKGNNIFTRATQIITDMSREKGMGGLEASSIRLGKALNDPVKGITALSRVGVQFTEQQKKQIKEMVKSGDILGAQKIILAELEEQFGGTAEAAATSGEKLAQSWGQLKESLGTALLPILDKLNTALIPIVEFMTKHPETVYVMAGALTVLGAALLGVAAAALLAQIAVFAIPLAIMAAIAAVILLAVLLWSLGPQIRAFFANLWIEIKQEAITAWNAIKTFFATQWAEIKAEWATAWGTIKTFFSTWWNEMKTEATTGATGVKAAADAHMKEMGQEWNTAWGGIKGLFKSWWTEMKQEATTGAKSTADAAGRLKGYIQAKFRGAKSWLKQAGKDIMQGLIDGIQWGIGKIESMLSGLTSKIPSWKGPPATDKVLLRDNGRLIIDGLIGGMQSRESGVRSTLQNLTSAIGSGVGVGMGGSFSPADINTAADAGGDGDLARAFGKALEGKKFLLDKDNRGLQLVARGG